MFTILNNSLILFTNSNEGKRNSDNLSDFENPKRSSNGPNSKPLLIYQHATISNTFFPLSMPINVSFTLLEDWISKNVTINYDGISHYKDWVINGTFPTGKAPWEYLSNNTNFVEEPWQTIDEEECIGIKILKGQSFLKGDYSYFEENLTIPENSASNTLATLSMKYFLVPQLFDPSNDISAFVLIDIGGKKVNTSGILYDLAENSWTEMKVTYDLSSYDQQLPENVTIRVGLHVESDIGATPPSKDQIIYYDNIEFKIWTEPNQPDLIEAKDIEFNKDYSYENLTLGKGKTFINVERNRTETSDIKFTISKNASHSEELEIYNITITSEAFKIFNSTTNGLEGSVYTSNNQISWETECSFSIPYSYLNNWAEIKKPSDWNITSVLNGYNTEKKGSCTGIGLGSVSLKIPKEILESGLWTIKAISQNYISYGGLNVLNGTDYIQQSNVTFGDIFQINATLNNTVDPENTYINCTIQYPNGSLYWQSNKMLSSSDVTFGSFTVGKNMTVGSYEVRILWTNNQSYINRDKVGYSQFNFIVWHHTNLTTVDFYLVRVSGEPLLIKVNFTDYDFNSYIDFATISYNSTITGGISGIMAYLGSGIYGAEVDTSSLAVGDYYFSFNASKNYYQNQSIRNLIQLKIIYQPITLEVPSTVINTNANSYAICHVNITGALTGTPITGDINITTNWHKPYTREIFGNGSCKLNFSTYDVPTQGTLETFTITIFANKTNYGSTSAYISLTVHPIPTIAYMNESIIDVYFNENFSLEVNYVVEESSEIITGATLNITWPSLYDILPTVDGFIIDFSTEGLSLDLYTLLIQLNHPGYETAINSVYVSIIPKSTSLEIFLNQVNKTSDRSISIPWNEPLNITILYKDSMSNNFIADAMVQVNGINTSEIFYQSIPHYSIIFNSDELPIGIHFLEVTAQKENYSPYFSVLKVTVIPKSTSLEIFLNQVNKTSDRSISIPWNEPLNIKILYKDSMSNDFITDATVQVNGTNVSEIFYQNIPQYSIIFNSGELPIGIHFLAVTAQKENYSTYSSVLKITIEQIEISIETLDFTDSLEVLAGKSTNLQIKLSESNSGIIIENANVTYSWDLNLLGEFYYLDNGTYETNLNIPSDKKGSYTMTLTVFIEGGIYKTTEKSFVVIVSQESTSNNIVWVIIIVTLLSITGIFGALVLRTYVFIPRKRKKEKIFMDTIQVFKDVKNIHGIMLIQKNSGIPFYMKNVSGFDFEDNFLISGFIQAITIFGEQVLIDNAHEAKKRKHKKIYSEHLIELNFKYFHLLICDYGPLKSILILKDKSSKKLKMQLYLFAVELDRRFSDKIENFVGKRIDFEDEIDVLLNQFLYLHYNEPFKLIEDKSYVQFLKKSRELQAIEFRILNVIISLTKLNKEFTLIRVIEEVDEKNIDLVYGGLHTLIKRRIIIPSYLKDEDSHPLIGGLK